MLKRETPKTIKADLTVLCQGEKIPLTLTYRNFPPAEYDAMVERVTEQVKALGKIGASAIMEVNVKIVSELLESWEAEYPLNEAGLGEAERDRPGLLYGIVRGYHQSREASVVKN